MRLSCGFALNRCGFEENFTGHEMKRAGRELSRLPAGFIIVGYSQRMISFVTLAPRLTM